MSWTILNMKHRTVDGYVIDVISAYEKQDGPGYARKTFNNVFEGTPGSGYIPYGDLTEEIVLGWVKNNLGADAVLQIELEVDAEALANKEAVENPIVEDGKPWDNDEFDPTQDQGGLTPS
jgi:hypothetical protein